MAAGTGANPTPQRLAARAGGLAIVLAALTARHLALIPAAGGVVALAGALLLAGCAIAPTEATIYVMVDDPAPAATLTEAFAWLVTAMAVGGAVGAASTGLLVARAGPTAGFAFAGAAGALAVLTTLLRSRTLALERPRLPCLTPRHTTCSEPTPADYSKETQMTAPPISDNVPQLLAGTRWRLDPSESSAEFQVPHFWGLVSVKGHFEQLDGWLEVGDRQELQMTLTIDAASLDTGMGRRDKHLRSADFFDTQNHSEVRFRSTSVSNPREHPLRLEGELEVAGKSVVLALEPTIQQSEDQLDIEATATVDQRKLGMTWSPLGMTRTPATLSVHARLRRAS